MLLMVVSRALVDFEVKKLKFPVRQLKHILNEHYVCSPSKF